MVLAWEHPFNERISQRHSVDCATRRDLSNTVNSGAVARRRGSDGTARMRDALSPTPATPHIVLVLCDDLGYNGVGYRNPQLHTPHIDTLAATGVRLESFYTAPTALPRVLLWRRQR